MLIKDDFNLKFIVFCWNDDKYRVDSTFIFFEKIQLSSLKHISASLTTQDRHMFRFFWRSERIFDFLRNDFFEWISGWFDYCCDAFGWVQWQFDRYYNVFDEIQRYYDRLMMLLIERIDNLIVVVSIWMNTMTFWSIIMMFLIESDDNSTVVMTFWMNRMIFRSLLWCFEWIWW